MPTYRIPDKSLKSLKSLSPGSLLPFYFTADARGKSVGLVMRTGKGVLSEGAALKSELSATRFCRGFIARLDGDNSDQHVLINVAGNLANAEVKKLMKALAKSGVAKKQKATLLGLTYQGQDYLTALKEQQEVARRAATEQAVAPEQPPGLDDMLDQLADLDDTKLEHPPEEKSDAPPEELSLDAALQMLDEGFADPAETLADIQQTRADAQARLTAAEAAVPRDPAAIQAACEYVLNSQQDGPDLFDSAGGLADLQLILATRQKRWAVIAEQQRAALDAFAVAMASDQREVVEAAMLKVLETRSMGGALCEQESYRDDLEVMTGQLERRVQDFMLQADEAVDVSEVDAHFLDVKDLHHHDFVNLPQLLQKTTGADHWQRVCALIERIVQVGMIMEARLAALFREAAETPRNMFEDTGRLKRLVFSFSDSERRPDFDGLRQELVEKAKAGKLTFGKVFSSGLWTHVLQPYDLQTNGGYAMNSMFLSLVHANKGDIQRIRSEEILDRLVPGGLADRAVPLATLQEVSPEMIDHIIKRAAGLTHPVHYKCKYAGKKARSGIIYRVDTQDGPPPPIPPDVALMQLTEPPDDEDTPQVTAEDHRLVLISAGGQWVMTAHFPAVSRYHEAVRNLDALEELLKRLIRLAEDTGQSVMFNLDANLPFTGTILDENDREVNMLEQIHARLSQLPVQMMTAGPSVKERESAMSTNQQFFKGGDAVRRCTMATFFIPAPGDHSSPVADAEIRSSDIQVPRGGNPDFQMRIKKAERLMTPDNPTDHQTFSVGGCVTLNGGWSGEGKGEDAETIRSKLTRREYLEAEPRPMIRRYEQTMQFGALRIRDEIKAWHRALSEDRGGRVGVLGDR